ncbi:MAG: UDP-N-acetylmuramate:L-alanyl-gamma-D-glutamyl-meso-diaminopimelate ligase [Thiotrichales bacterium]|nr:UDP-N-acetylmuramate:L-alanyl-gamma-D-glutamyl-meso-diaminopimelate ligase [Thiotrichales bacterium]MBT3614186.1 UDP-N-acetylmuramate:L-alanyl-gamma-D-glutamyl-meso-diaminopimelate ligase [Thiotrichales bacterium]MBT3752004.1 UDP-N-acetylmuramate:L-alanyl-gamma-D-glutamyl-meso-diaminopimelate ligase [Thiotrichales bacterium]MBT3837387.1 UDP-N-acetylmuramate:L-alanyl-gamma-D-glutamyl-meso-diaminopimelate ligase [Thiotrichales bacterium]MBT4152672.1 UDP-N-acetylmuramate:L-alanyl-gamma-D-glutam
MHIHILGICGTFMGGIALLAREAGHTVSGSDLNVYPPMSDQLAAAGITLQEGYDSSHLDPSPDQVVVGNALSRGNPAVEYMLNQGIPYISGPQWLAENILQDRWVLALSGTHGKTTTASMVAWILEYAGLTPGFLIGGVPQNFGLSARLGNAPFFVVEADEYDTAFFDKRSKFVHYHPRTLVFNNLEFDHADIFADLAAIQTQFHHLIRTVPANGLVIYPAYEEDIDEVLARGLWTPVETIGERWNAEQDDQAWSKFSVILDGVSIGKIEWELTGKHNRSNALAAIAATRHAGVPTKYAIEALCKFKNVKRRMELIGEVNGIAIYDDFAHHPTAIELTLNGVRGKVKEQRILAIMEPRSNTMQMGIHKESLLESFEAADRVMLLHSEELAWDLAAAIAEEDLDSNRVTLHKSVDEIVSTAAAWLRSDDTVVVMSNGGFGGIHQKLLQIL